jgi:hypothetical protein
MRSKRRGSARRNIPVLPIIGVAAGLGIPALQGLQTTGGNMSQKGISILDSIGTSIYGYSTVNKAWETSNLASFWAPVAGTTIAHIALSKLGVNKILARARLGFTL